MPGAVLLSAGLSVTLSAAVVTLVSGYFCAPNSTGIDGSIYLPVSVVTSLIPRSWPPFDITASVSDQPSTDRVDGVADDLHLAIGDRLEDDGQRYTSGRRSLVDVLRQAGRPLTTSEILAAGSLAQSSAYRNLSVLETCGVVHRVAGTDDYARFELAEDLTDHHHHHLICTVCGSVADFTVSDHLERDLEAAMERVVETTGFQSDHHRFDLLGRCINCY